MSGPLRRNQRSRPADAGEPLQEGLAAEPEGAAPTAETPPSAPERAGEPVAEPAAHSGADEPAGGDAPGENAGSDAAAQEQPTEAVAPEVRAGDESSRASTPQPDTPDESAGATTPDVDAANESAGATTPDVSAANESAGARTPDPSGPDKDADSAATAQMQSADATTPEPGTLDEPAGARASETASEAPTAATPAEGVTPAEGLSPITKPRRARWRPFRKGKRIQATGATPPAPAPVLVADPDTPAGLDPAEAPMQPPVGRRGRLRRRLRYLRRARELMLRDLGGLLYEVHRTGGGRVEAHATVVGAKVQRIAGLDAEAHALETALTAPRGETVVFEPGIGGTCAACGELYGSDAHFCSNCGAPVGTAAPVVPAREAKTPETAADEPARRAFWRRAARAPEGPPETTPDETTSGEADTATPDETPAPPAGDAPAEERHTTDAASDEPPETRGDDPAAPRADAASAPPGEEPRNPSSRTRNGRPEDYKPPGSSSADSLVSRELRS
jgi:hypothetical protein